jgi:hypothetical protein
MSDMVIVHTSNDRDVMLKQLAGALFAHPQCPPHLFENAHRDAYRYFRFHGSGANAASVQLLKNEMWSTEQLAEMAPGIVEAAHGSLSFSTKPPSIDYAYDLLATLYDHPSADEPTREYAKQHMARIKERANPKFIPKGPKAWSMTPLGIPLPDYN